MKDRRWWWCSFIVIACCLSVRHIQKQWGLFTFFCSACILWLPSLLVYQASRSSEIPLEQLNQKLLRENSYFFLCHVYHSSRFPLVLLGLFLSRLNTRSCMNCVHQEHKSTTDVAKSRKRRNYRSFLHLLKILASVKEVRTNYIFIYESFT